MERVVNARKRVTSWAARVEKRFTRVASAARENLRHVRQVQENAWLRKKRFARVASAYRKTRGLGEQRGKTCSVQVR